jgi:hypothetical protein
LPEEEIQDQGEHQLTPDETKSTGDGSKDAAKQRDEVALELMKFIAVTTGYGRAKQSSAGFQAKPATLSAEEHADALLELFERCRKVVNT